MVPPPPMSTLPSSAVWKKTPPSFMMRRMRATYSALARIRRIMNEGGVFFQTAELGKVDIGGGGTIAYILAEYGMQVIDCGVPVLSMHAPWEVVSKADVYEAYRGYKAFLAAE